jgi:hypothetical protein
MSDASSEPTPKRNPVTQAAHRRQVFWQITVPLAAGVFLFVLLAILVSIGGAEHQSRWADIALIWVLCPNILVTLICLILLVAFVYGMFQLTRVLPGFALRVQGFLTRFQSGVQRTSDVLVEPVLKAHSARAGRQTLRKQIGNLFKSKPNKRE